MIRENESVLRFCKICFLILLAAACLYFVFFQLAEKPIDLDTTNAVELNGFTAEDRAGNRFTVQQGIRYEFNDNDLFDMKGTLPEGIREEIICFLSFYDTEVFIGGEKVYSYSMTDDVRVIGGAVKSIYHFIQLDDSCSGRELVIRQHRGASENCRAGAVYFGTVSDIYRLMFRKYGATFIMGLMLLCVALIILVFGLAVQIRTKTRAGIVTISLAVALTAGWIVTDSYFYPFIFGHNHIDGLMSYLLCMLLPCPYIFYVSALQKGRYRKVYTIMMVITLVNFVVCTGLHLAGIVKLYDSLIVIDILLVAAIAEGTLILIKEFRGGYIRAYRYTAIGLIGFMACVFIEILLILAPDLVNSGRMILIGLMWLLGFAVAQQIEDSRISDLERQQAIELSRTKSSFLASMSHEIRTPINSIMGMNEMILRESRDPEICRYASTIQRSGRMLLSLINDVLDYSRIEAGKLEIVEDQYSLSELLTDIMTIAEERAEQKGLNYKVTIGEQIPDGLCSDEVRIKQILLNLVSNAVKYTDEGGIEIAVDGSYSDDETFDLTFEVKDTGRGIREEDQRYLFEAFSRSDLKKNRSIEGTGLGLAIVKSITDSMNGSITVESEYQKGSVFTVTLPQKVVDHTPMSLKTLKTAGSKDGRRLFTAPDAFILAVDDNRPNLSIVSAFLKDTKAHVELCTNGEDALTKCRERKYDLILLDHMMPEPDGIQTLELIRRDPDSLNKTTAAVVLTANAVSGSRQMYLRAGFADYLTKPLEADALEETVRKLLPAELIREAETGNDVPDDEIMEFEAAGTDSPAETELPESLRSIPGLNIDEALAHTGGSSELLKEILKDIASGARSTAKELRQSAQKQDYEQYRITAHSIKGLMATIGAQEISVMAKRHEYAARNGEYAYIEEHYGVFTKAYEDLCGEILRAIGENG